MISVEIIPARNKRRPYWLVIDIATKKCLEAAPSMSEAIYFVEQEGYVLVPYNYEKRDEYHVSQIKMV